MELRELAGESNDDFAASVSVPTESNNFSKAPEKIAGSVVYKNSKAIKKTERKGGIKEKEKARRMKGQSSISTWKPEMFMKLRQEFD